MVYHVAEVISVEGKEAVLKLIDANVHQPLSGSVCDYFHNFQDAERFMEEKRKEYGPYAPDEQPVRFVVVAY
jgi:hypothetical protein